MKLVLGAMIPLILCSAGCPRQNCMVPDNGMGTADLPPTCGTNFIGPIDSPEINNGLPPGSTIVLHNATIVSLVRHPILPGGILGGDMQATDATMAISLHGTGALAGFQRVVNMPMTVKIHSAPRPYGAPFQAFPVHVFSVEGQINGDPDFDLLRITGGDLWGMPSPGHVELTSQPGNQWAVNSFYDVMYRIEYVGAPGGALSGMAGNNQWMKHLLIGVPPAQAEICPMGDMNLDRHLDGADLSDYVAVFIAGPSDPRFCRVDGNANGASDSGDIVVLVDALLHWPSPAPSGSSYWEVPASCDNTRIIIVTCGPGPVEYRAIRAADTDNVPSTCPVKFQLRTCDGIDDPNSPVTTLSGGATGCIAVPPNRELAVWCEPTPGGTCRISAKSTTPCP